MRAPKEILHALLGSMEEQTLALAQKLARQATIEENNDSDSSSYSKWITSKCLLSLVLS